MTTFICVSPIGEVTLVDAPTPEQRVSFIRGYLNNHCALIECTTSYNIDVFYSSESPVGYPSRLNRVASTIANELGRSTSFQLRGNVVFTANGGEKAVDLDAEQVEWLRGRVDVALEVIWKDSEGASTERG